MKFVLPSVLVLVAGAIVAGCAVPTEESEPAREAVSALSTCTTAADCPWEWKNCVEAVCVSGVCGTAARAAGSQCTSGVGICQANGDCKAPVGLCKPQGGPSVCLTSADCIDSYACTWGECVGGACHYTPDANGGPCAIAGSACNWGACCEMPAGLCEQPAATTRYCSASSQCDDHDSCTDDTCENGACRHFPHRNGTYCTKFGSGEGQCLDGACCNPTPPTSCEEPWVAALPPQIAQCLNASQCDDHDSCTDDDCVIGSCHYVVHADNSACTTSSSTSGQCFGGICCLP